jgi:RND superfamily putative drug exporter
MLQVSDVTTEENQYSGKAYESLLAEELVEEQFPSSGTNASIILVIRGSNVISAEARDSTISLEESIEDSPEVQALDKVVSIYDFYAQAFEDLAYSLGPSIYMIADDKNLTYALEVISVESGIGNLTFLQSIYDLGRTPSEMDVEAFAWNAVKTATLDEYPISLPSGASQSFLSLDNATMLVLVTFTTDSQLGQMGGGNQEIANNVEVIRQMTKSVVENSDGQLTIFVTGDVALAADEEATLQKDLALIAPVTVILILVLMSLFFRSVLAPFLPLGAIGMTIGLSQAAVFIIGSYFVNISSSALIILFVVLFGVGTDYSVFILTRYREEREKGSNAADAMRTSITWAGESISTSGLAVVISVGVLSFSSFSMMQSMGSVVSVGVLIALLASLTLVPAIAISTSKRLFQPRARKEKQRKSTGSENAPGRRQRERYFRRAARISVTHPYWVLFLALVLSLPAGLLYLASETSYDMIGGMPDSDSIRGLKAISESFGSGLISPTLIVIQFDQDVVLSNGSFDSQLLYAIDGISENMSAISNVCGLTSPTRVNDERIPFDILYALPEVEREAAIVQIHSMIGQDNRTVLLQLVFDEEPFSEASLNTVKEIRSFLVQTKTSDALLREATVLVGGQSAIILDTSMASSSEFRDMEILVAIGLFIVLLLVLGSVVLPLVTVLSVLLSVSWILAATFLVFDTLLGKPVLFMVPPFLFLLLMGLGMDYNIFILTRVREEVCKSGDHVEAIVEAVDKTGGIITACALIMASAFGTMMLSGIAMLQEFGFALAFGVLLDAMFVRTYFTPAIIKVLGPKWTWWAPKVLQRTRPGLHAKSNERSVK